MATDIQVSGVNIQAEIEENNPAVSGVNLQAEIGIPDVQVSGVNLQVEILEAEPGLDFECFEGQYLQVYFDDDLYFTGIISDVEKQEVTENSDKIELDVSVTNLKNIPARRTIRVNYDTSDTTDDIINDMIDSYLYQEGIEAGTIDTGITIGEEWLDDCISIADVLDQCADKCGFQWFIDKDMKLHCYQDPAVISDAAHQLVDGNGFSDYRNVQISGTIDGYVNKIFVVGGNDGNGNQIFSLRGDLSKQNAMQDICAGTGVYGIVNRDGSNVEYTEVTAGAGTTTTNLEITGHNLVVGDFVWNYTRNTYTYVTEVVNENNVTVETVASQTSGDTIIYYPSANLISENTLKKQSTLPKTIKFDTFEIDFEPQTKLNVELIKFGIESSYWNIEEVSINDEGNSLFKSSITAVLRDESNFSTQKRNLGTEFFKDF